MIKNEIKVCPKCKKKVFVSLLDDKGQLLETQFIGLRKISETKVVNGENKNFICALCRKPGKSLTQKSNQKTKKALESGKKKKK